MTGLTSLLLLAISITSSVRCVVQNSTSSAPHRGFTLRPSQNLTASHSSDAAADAHEEEDRDAHGDEDEDAHQDDDDEDTQCLRNWERIDDFCYRVTADSYKGSTVAGSYYCRDFDKSMDTAARESSYATPIFLEAWNSRSGRQVSDLLDGAAAAMMTASPPARVAWVFPSNAVIKHYPELVLPMGVRDRLNCLLFGRPWFQMCACFVLHANGRFGRWPCGFRQQVVCKYRLESHHHHHRTAEEPI